MATSLFRLRIALFLEALSRSIRLFKIAFTALPIAGGDGTEEEGGKKEEEEEETEEKEPKEEEEEEEEEESPPPKTPKEPEDWKRRARKNERELKRVRDRNNELELAANNAAAKNKTDHEKAVDDAKKEARDEAEREFVKERRQDRLETATTTLASKGIKMEVKEGKEVVEKTVKFSDPDDALVHLERMVRRGEIDADELFDKDNRVNKDALGEALSELLEKKPHLGNGGKSTKKSETSGDGDQGKGGGRSSSEAAAAEEEDPDAQFAKIHRGSAK